MKKGKTNEKKEEEEEAGERRKSVDCESRVCVVVFHNLLLAGVKVDRLKNFTLPLYFFYLAYCVTVQIIFRSIYL